MAFFPLLIVTLMVIAVTLMEAAEDRIPTIEAEQGQNVTLPCFAPRKSDVNYWTCRWYKEGADPRLTGLVCRTPPHGSLMWYVGADKEITMDASTLSLELPPVTCSSSGLYQCYLAAPVGEQNREGRVWLSVLGCPEELEERPELLVLVLLVLLVLMLVSGIAVTWFVVRKAKRNKAKPVEKLLYPDLSRPLEKTGLILPSVTLPRHYKPSVPLSNV